MTRPTEADGQESHQAGLPVRGLFSIGGVGGSGTRAVAMLVRNCGVWIGDDLNPALDNLAFTLMFKRASVLVDPDARLETLFGLFVRRLKGACLSEDEMDTLSGLARHSSFGHPAEWRAERLQKLGQTVDGAAGSARHAWKEPNTHVVIERLMQICPDLTYVHVVRDPFYMAGSANQNQLMNWGHIFLNRPVEVTPRDVLAYWVAVHMRLTSLQAAYPRRILFTSYDRLNADPIPEAGRLLSFLGLHPPAEPQRLFEGLRLQTGDSQETRATPAGCAAQDVEFCEDFMAGLAMA